jgi:hypothetical protein
MITGERGIGKTSLLNFLKYQSQGLIPVGDTKVSFLVVDTDVDQSTTQIGLVKKIQLGLDKSLGESEKARAFLKEAWGFIKRVEVGGIKIKGEEALATEELLPEEFSYSLARIADRVCMDEDGEHLFSSKQDGILILIDEADNGSPGLHLGTFLKLLTERLQKRRCNRVMFGLAGLPNLRNALSQSHSSAPRLFEENILERLSDSEVSMVIDMCLKDANKKNEQKTSITENGRSKLISLSEGYPHFIQQFGYSAFAIDTDGEIDETDVSTGALGKRGALELIGDQYYRDSFYIKIQGESYRQVLRIMAESPDGWVSKKEIKKKFKGSTTTLDNAIAALRERQIIFSKEGQKGVYRLQHKGFALWIKIFTDDPAKLQRSVAAAPSAT